MGDFLKKHYQLIIVIAIIALAIFLRFYRLDEYMTFLGDEGRDALIVKKILIEHDFPLLGPPTSVGNIYLGPLYYYMMAVAMAVWWLNPVAAASMVASIGVLTVILIFYLANKWFNFWPAVLSSTLYAVSFVTVTYSRSSWNPNPAPFFSLLALFGFYKAHQTRKFLWLVLTGLSVGAAIQMHYLALILIPIFIILWIFEVFIYQAREKMGNFIAGTLLSITAFIFTTIPIIIFDFKYNYMNAKAIQAMFSSNEAVGGNLFANIFKIFPIYYNSLIGRYLGAEIPLLTILIAILVAFPLIISVFHKLAHQKVSWQYIALGVWLLVGLLGLGQYKFSIYDHYLGFLNPVPFLLLGAVIYGIKGKWQIMTVGLVILIIGWVNLDRNPLKLSPNDQLKRSQEVSRYIIRESQNKPFNFALIAQRNYDSAYQYFLEIYGHKPMVVPINITDQLFVVCEDSVCNPINNPKYEIAAYGWAKIDQVSELDGVKIFKLVPNPEGKPTD